MMEFFVMDRPKNQNLVAHFMSLMNQERNVPVTSVRFKFRRALLDEEIMELKEALWASFLELRSTSLLKASTRIKLIKEMADVLYVLYGFAETFGFNLDEAFRIVHESNMSKFNNGQPVKDNVGKVLKSESYKEPELHNVW